MELGDQTVLFLQKAARRLPADHLILKSYYLTQCRTHIAQKSATISEKKLGIPKQRCPKCSLPWNESGFYLKNKPARSVSKTVQKKLLRKATSDVQQGILKADFSGKLQVKICKFCKYEMIHCAQPKDESKNNVAAPITNTNTACHKEKKKRKAESNNFTLASSKSVFTYKEKVKEVVTKPIKKSKKKDKFAGLCQAAVLSAKNITNDKLQQFLKQSK